MATAQQPLVLVVDDEALIRQMEMRILQSGGYRTLEAESGLEAIRMLDEGVAVDLLIADLEMPDLTGDVMVGRIHAARPNLKVLYVTAFDVPTVEDVGKVLRKPISNEELVREIRFALAR